LKRVAEGLLVVAALGGCDAWSTDPVARPVAAPSTTLSDDPEVKPRPSPPADPAFAVVEPSGAGGPLRVVPRDNGDGRLPHVPVRPSAETMLTHVTEFGWAPDSSVFAFCFDDLDEGACEVYDPSGRQTLSMPATKQWAAWKAGVGGIDKGPAEWAFPDVTITWRTQDARIEVGAKTGEGRGKRNVVTFPHFDEDWPEAVGMLELVSVSPSGHWLALVGHEAVAETHNEFYVEFRRTRTFAAEAYAARGFRALRADRFDDAATWFMKATRTDAAWKHPYNVACARSRGNVDGVRPALEEAIRRGGEVVRAKARRDADLDSARAQPWFSAVVGE